MNPKFIKLSILLVLSRSFDFITTYIYTPDLANESNVLVNLFHLNYMWLFIIQLCLLIFVIWCLFYYINNKYTININDKLLSFKKFIPFFHFNSEQKFIAFFYKSPNIKSIIYTIGYIVSMSLTYIGFIVGTSTTLLITSEYYNRLYSKGGTIIGYSLISIIVVLFTIIFYRNEYNKYKNKYEQLNKE